MVLLSPEGRVQQAFVLQASENFRVPAVMRSLSLHALRGSRTVQQLTAHEWTDIGPDVATGSLMVKVAPGTTVLCYVGDDEPLWPRMVDYSSESISVEITPFDRLTSTPQDTSQLDAVDGSSLAQKVRLRNPDHSSSERAGTDLGATGPGRNSGAGDCPGPAA